MRLPMTYIFECGQMNFGSIQLKPNWSGLEQSNNCLSLIFHCRLPGVISFSFIYSSSVQDLGVTLDSNVILLFPSQKICLILIHLHMHSYNNIQNTSLKFYYIFKLPLSVCMNLGTFYSSFLVSTIIL